MSEALLQEREQLSVQLKRPMFYDMPGQVQQIPGIHGSPGVHNVNLPEDHPYLRYKQQQELKLTRHF